MTSFEFHLAPDLLHRLVEPAGDSNPSPDLEQARMHLAVCASCRRRFSYYEAAEQGLQSLRRGASPLSKADDGCPADQEWAQLAAGLVDEAEAGPLLDHAASCGHCGLRLRQSTEDLAPELTPAEERLLGQLPSSQSNGRSGLAARMAAVASAGSPGWQPGRRWKPWVSAAAATAIVIAGLAVVIAVRERRGGTPADAQKLLAQAYSSNREMELRIPGAGYARPGAERGAINRSARLTLLRAELLIAQALNRQPNNSTWLALDGRADLLEGRFQQAQDTLERALRIQPDSPEIFTDLATAEFELAQQQGRDDEYMAAAARLTDALKLDPLNPVALFNRAIVYEEIGSYPLAIKDWQEYLKLDPSSQWAAKEAGQRLNRLLKRVNVSPQSQLAPTAPAAAAAWLANRMANTTGSYGLADSGEEQLLDVALTEWLPDVGSVSGNAAGPAQAAELTALDRLAAVLAARHGDRWLSDVLAVPRSPALAPGFAALAAAIGSNAAGHAAAAQTEASRATILFRAGGNPAAALRAQLELAYALQRAEINDLRCTATARSALASLGNHPYPQLQAQLLLELSAGEGMANHFGAAKQDALRAVRLSEESHFGALYLRSVGFAGGTATAVGDYREAWRWDRLGLERYWSGSYPRMREYQFYADMGFAAEAAGDWPLAEALTGEALDPIEHTPNRPMEAVARFRVAKLAAAAGDRTVAREEFERSARIFASLPADPAFEIYQAWCQIYLADSEVQSGAPDRALERLLRAAPQIAGVKNADLSLRYYRGIGEAYLASGDAVHAEESLANAIGIAENALGSLTNESDRVAWASGSAGAYRSLVRAELKGRNDPVSSLGIWEWYRSGPVRALGKRADWKPASTPALANLAPTSLPSFAKAWIRSQQAHLTKETVISYAEFPDGIEIWVLDDRGISSRWVAIPASVLNRVARRFAQECAVPDSDLAMLYADGRQLYQWLFAPIAARIDSARVLVFETDGVISRVPLQALVDPAGNYLASRFAIVASPSLGYDRLRKPEPAISAGDRILAVGAPSLSGEWQTMLAPLPEADAEAQAVASNFRSAVVLSGSGATLPSILNVLPRAQVFHFAGHALIQDKRSGLVLAASDPPGPAGAEAGLLEADQLEPRRLRECRLAVLSSCSTADTGGSTLVDPESLVGAFLLAGVPNVVASRWTVNSAVTAVLMKTFYQRLLAGVSASRALQQAAQAVRRNPETARPYYWAAFGDFGQG